METVNKVLIALAAVAVIGGAAYFVAVQENEVEPINAISVETPEVVDDFEVPDMSVELEETTESMGVE